MSSLAVLTVVLLIVIGALWVAGLIPTIINGTISFIGALGSNLWLLIILLFIFLVIFILTRPKVLKGLGIGAGGVGVAVAGSAAASKLGSMVDRLDSDFGESEPYSTSEPSAPSPSPSDRPFDSTDEEPEELSEINLSGNNWEIFIRSLRQIKDFPDIRRRLLDSFTKDMSFSSSGKFSTTALKRFYNHIEGLDKNEIPKATYDLLTMAKQNGAILNDSLLDLFSQQLESKYGPPTSYKNRETHKRNMTEAADKAEQRMQEIISDIESDEKTERHVIELQESAKEELKDALERFHKHRNEINVLRQLGEAQGGQFTVSELMQNLDQIEKKTGTDFRDQQAIKDLVNNLERVEQELKDAHQKIKEADHELKQVEDVDVEIDEHLKVLEQEELQWTKEAKETAENLNGRLQWSG